MFLYCVLKVHYLFMVFMKKVVSGEEDILWWNSLTVRCLYCWFQLQLT